MGGLQSGSRAKKAVDASEKEGLGKRGSSAGRGTEKGDAEVPADAPNPKKPEKAESQKRGRQPSAKYSRIKCVKYNRIKDMPCEKGRQHITAMIDVAQVHYPRPAGTTRKSNERCGYAVEEGRIYRLENIPKHVKVGCKYEVSSMTVVDAPYVYFQSSWKLHSETMRWFAARNGPLVCW